jgi:hypothetical protein
MISLYRKNTHILHHYFMDFMIVEKLRSVEKLEKKNYAHSTETKSIDRPIPLKIWTD